MDPLQDPVPGNSGKKSDSEDDIPLAAVRERKDAKGKVKKSTNNNLHFFITSNDSFPRYSLDSFH